MQNDGAEGRAAHACIGDADNVTHTLAEQTRWNRQLAPLRHARTSLRAGVAQNHDRLLLDLDVIDAGSEVIDVVKHDGFAPVLQKVRAGGASLDERSPRRQVSL